MNRLLRETLRLTKVLSITFLALSAWGAAEMAGVWLSLNGFWFFGVPLFVFAMAAGIVAMDEYA